MRWIQRQSLLHWALGIALVVGLIAPLGVTSFYTFSLQRQSLSDSFRFETEQIAETLANGMSDPVWNLIPDSGRPLIVAALRDPRVLAVEVYSDAQGEFLSLGAAAEGPQLLEVSRNIFRSGTIIGTLRVFIDTTTMNASLDAQWRRIGISAAMEVVLVLTIIAVVGGIFIRYQRTQMLRDTNRLLEQEIDERRRTESALRDSEERFRTLAKVAPVGIFETNVDGHCEHVNDRWCQISGLTETDALGTGWAQSIHPEDRKMVFEEWCAATRTQRPFSLEYRFQRPDGRVSWVLGQTEARLDQQNNVVGYVGAITNISARKSLEAQFVQAQKMEAVGQLTGGLAHDFNNLLAVILGNTELLGDEIEESHLLTTISRAATRGAELTQRLLAFSRQQTLQPQSIDLTELVPGIHDLLHRTLGEPIKIVTDIPEDIWPVLADPGQLESALLNLSINARDAMPDGGFLEITCCNMKLEADDPRVSSEVSAGDYVQIAVRDTGSGMAEDVIEHAFEPFYTTKDVGEGSGLGLSMVYGFARQSDGDAVIESTPGMGSEVRIFLPRSEVTTAPDKRTQDNDLNQGQGEVILVLEDDPDVRSLAVAALERLAYRVLEAADANAAMQVLEEEADNIDLLLSDVVLPGGVSGPEFATKAKDLCPKLKIVFMTGYASGLDATDKISNIGEALLSKPFKRADLAKVIHDTLTT